MAPAATILPDPTRLRLVRLTATDACITAVVETLRPAALCPLCGGASTRVHSRYVRRVADLPWHGVAFRLQLHVRRFFCDRLGCLRRVFAERLPGLVAPHARRTERLTRWLRAVSFALGGEAGARLLRSLGLVASADTLVREIRRTSVSTPPRPSVVSVDDWRLRRGQRYGAILVDLERQHVVDRLPDREADTFASWLRARPPVAVVSRDRGANFAEGASRGAPQAMQVADRCHVLKNVVEALQQVLGREQAQLHAAARAVWGTGGVTGAHDLAAQVFPLRARGDTAPRERARAQAQARRPLRFEACRWLQASGQRVREIAAELHMGPKTIRRFLRADACPQRAAVAPHPSRLTPFEPYLRARWDAGEQNGRHLLAEIRGRGDRGSGSNLYSLLALWRPGPRRPGPYPRQARVTPAPPPPPRVAPRAAGWLLVREDGDRAPQEAAFVDELLRRSPAVATMCGAVRRFCAMLRQKRADDLAAWLEEADTSGIPELAAFAQGGRRDLPAIHAAFTSPWGRQAIEQTVASLLPASLKADPSPTLRSPSSSFRDAGPITPRHHMGGSGAFSLMTGPVSARAPRGPRSSWP